jgi:tRNA-splicing ligase RtcB
MEIFTPKDKTYDIMRTDGLVPVKMWTRGVQLEDEARKQLSNITKMPFIFRWVAAMPDCHWGMGATVGSVIPTKKAIIPAGVGVDIGCGMVAARTSLRASDLPDDLVSIRHAIEAAVPHGRTDNGGPNDRGAWKNAPKAVEDAWSGLAEGHKAIVDKHPKLARSNTVSHLGSLGTGNHFIEICVDEDDAVWIMLHSGSRGIGNSIGKYFIELAKKDMQKWCINVPDQDLSYLPEGTDNFNEYWKALMWAQKFAQTNRDVMLNSVIAALRKCGLPDFEITSEVVNCHHNYAALEHHYGEDIYVTRKGAVRAQEGDLGIIPGSMGTRSYIVRGKGNPESFNSCSHGAGRAMSRGEAKKKFSLADHERATAGVECRKDIDVIDETPMAYKSIDSVMEAQKDLVDIVHTLKQVICVKG